MVDIAEIEKVWGVWAEPLLKYRTNTLTKADVVEALRSDGPIPREARDMLAEIISGTGRPLAAHRPKKWPEAGTETGSGRIHLQMVTILVKELTRAIKDPSQMDDRYIHPSWRVDILEAHKRSTYKRRKRVAPKQQAKAWVAELYDVSPSTIRDWLRKGRELNKKD